MIQRSQHWLDEPQARGRKRTICNWMHWRAPSAGRDVADSDAWQESVRRAAPHGGVIPSWTGNIDMAFAALEGPLQAFAGDTTDANNSALWGVRRADRPNSWTNWKAYGVNPGVSPRIDTDEQGNVIGATWIGLWPGADLQIVYAGHKAEKRIIVKERSAQTRYEFTLKVAPAHDVVQVGDTLSIRDSRGVEQLRTSPPWAHDSATTGIGPDGHQHYAATLTRGADVRGLARYVIDIKPEDLAGAVLPVVIDPDTVISGTTDIEDSFIPQTGTANYGAAVYVACGSNGTHVSGLYRLATAALPAGAITGFTHYVHNWGYPAETANVRYMAVTPANTWVEGTANGTEQIGSTGWNHCITTSQAWAGSAGCSTIGTDTHSEASYTTYDSSPTVMTEGDRSLALTPSWVSNWKSGAWVNNGFLIRESVLSRGASRGWTHRSTEYSVAGQRPYFTITYVLGGAAAMLARRIHE